MRGRHGRHDRHGGLAVAAEHGMQQVRLLGLGRQSGRRTAALDVDDEKRKLQGDGEANGLGLEVDSWAARRGDPERPAECRPKRSPDAGDLVLGLQRADAEVLVLGQLVQDVRGRRDRIGPKEQRHVAELTGGDQAPGKGGVPGDVRIGAWLMGGGADLVGGLEQLSRLAEVVTRPERQRVGLDDDSVVRKPLGDPTDRRVRRALVEPRDEAQGEEVLAPLRFARLGAGRLARFERERRHRHFVDAELREAAVAERARRVPGLLECSLVEGVGVHDDGATGGNIGDVGPEGRRVHRHEHVRRVTWRQDLVVGDVHLER